MQSIKQFFVKNYLMIFSLIIFMALTIPKLMGHFAWFDEAHAWILAKAMDYGSFVQILKEEGHFILWYLLLMPFAKSDFGYPFSMLIINYVFYFLALVVMWKKAPFNPILKVFITFSWLSLNYFPIVARCYSMGILGLFILASMYKKQTEKPVIYAIVLALTAHTAFLNTIAVFPLGFIFLYNLYKNRNKVLFSKLVLSCAILILAGVLLVFPFVHGYGSAMLLMSKMPKFYKIFLDFPSVYCFVLYCLSLFSVFYFADNKIRFWIVLTITQFVLCFSFIYLVTPHHIALLFIYLIPALWLTPEIQKKSIQSNIFTICFCLLMIWSFGDCLDYAVKPLNQTDLVNYLKQNPSKEHLYLNVHEQNILPYLGESYNVIYEYNDDCSNSYKCAQKTITEYLKNNNIQNYSSILMVSDKALNQNSIPFCSNEKYVTKFHE